MLDRGRQLARWVYAQLGGAYFRILAVGGPVVVVFFVIWPLSTVVVVVLVATFTPLLGRIRKSRVTHTEPTTGAAADGEQEEGGQRSA